MDWRILAGIATLLVTVNALLRKQLTTFSSFDPVLMTAWLCGGASLCAFFIQLIRGKSLIPQKGLLLWLVVFSVTYALFSTSIWTGILKAPNPGYISAIVPASALLVCIISVFLFGSEFNFLRFVGAFLIILGTAFLLNPFGKT